MQPDERRDLGTTVNSSVVPDDRDLPRDLLEQLLEEPDHFGPGDVVPLQVEVEFAIESHSTDDRHLLPVSLDA